MTLSISPFQLPSYPLPACSVLNFMSPTLLCFFFNDPLSLIFAASMYMSMGYPPEHRKPTSGHTLKRMILPPQGLPTTRSSSAPSVLGFGLAWTCAYLVMDHSGFEFLSAVACQAHEDSTSQHPPILQLPHSFCPHPQVLGLRGC